MAIPIPAPHVAAFEKLGFGMFAHWGLYSQLGRGEWVYNFEHMNMEEYVKLADTFTAEDFDADKFVLAAKNAGCRYITLTTRHHEGFSLYDTCGLNTFDAPHSAAKRDLVKEYVDACNRHGLLPVFYHTTLDWYNPDFYNNFDKYLDYLNASVEILCTNYGKIGGLWFDGNWSKPGADWKEDRLYATIRRHQPEAMIINNTGLSARGETGHPEIDSVTFEQGHPTPMKREGMKKYVAAEMCYTMNDNWGIGLNDFNYKSPRELIGTLCDCRRVGANLLLNIGPTAQGGIDPMQQALLTTMGRWNALFGEAIYEGKPCGGYGMGKNFILRGHNCLYLFCFDLGRYGDSHVTTGNTYYGAYAFGGVKDAIKSVRWMDNGEELTFAQAGDMLSVHLTYIPSGSSYCVRVAKAEI